MRIIMIVVITLALNATIGISTLAYCLVNKIDPNQVLLTSFIASITGILGIIGGMLVKTSPTATTTTPPSPSPPPNGVTPVQVVNEPTDPVPTKEENKSLAPEVKET